MAWSFPKTYSLASSQSSVGLLPLSIHNAVNRLEWHANFLRRKRWSGRVWRGIPPPVRQTVATVWEEVRLVVRARITLLRNELQAGGQLLGVVLVLQDDAKGPAWSFRAHHFQVLQDPESWVAIKEQFIYSADVRCERMVKDRPMRTLGSAQAQVSTTLRAKPV